MDSSMRGLEEIRAEMSALDGQIAELYRKRTKLTEEEVGVRLSAGKKIFGFTQVESFDFEQAKVVFQGVNGAYSQ